MNILKIIYIIVLFFSLSGCNNKDEVVKEQPSYATGYNLYDLGLKVIINDEMKIINSNINLPISNIYGIENTEMFTKDDSENDYKIYGSMSIIYLRYYENEKNLKTIPIKFIQAFKKIDIIDNKKLIGLDKNYYNYKELAKNLIYENENWLVYDISNYISLIDIEEKVKSIDLEFNLKLIKPYKYLEENLRSLICKNVSSDIDYLSETYYIFVKGHSLSEMGLTSKYDDIKFVDPNNLIKYEPFFSQYDTDVTFVNFGEDYDVYGDITIIGANFCDNSIDMNFIPMKYIQGFKKEHFKNEFHVIKLSSVLYSLGELKKSIIYEDEKWIIIDISDYLDIKDVNTKIELLNESNKDYDYSWLMQMYKFINEYIGETIENRKY